MRRTDFTSSLKYVYWIAGQHCYTCEMFLPLKYFSLQVFSQEFDGRKLKIVEEATVGIQ